MLPKHAPFAPDQRNSLGLLISSLTDAQRAWLGGYLSAPDGSVAVIPSPAGAVPLTILYGTESGNCEALADRAAKTAGRRGFRAVVRNMAETTPAELAQVSNLLVIVSTWGDGEPPDSAAPFYNELLKSPLALHGTSYTVCALGDTSYDKFCHIGREIDARLETLGARRAADRQECDVDFEDGFSSWLDRALSALLPAGVAVVQQAVVAPVPAVEYGKKLPFPSELKTLVQLNGEGSQKHTVHLELSLEGSGLVYEPGDALAVIPINHPEMVSAVLAACKLSGEEQINTKATGSKRLADALRDDFDITTLSRNVLTKLAERCGSEPLKALLADEEKTRFKEYVHGREILDALQDFAPSGLSANDLAGLFRKLPPRLYSIASSPLAHPGEVHLTVAAVRYHSHGRSRQGVCSTYLSDRVRPGDAIPVFVQPNKAFRLPSDGDTPIIMVGPGTGIAPFRAFVEHRAAVGAKGKSWLFMGDQHYLYDFLYQLEWQDHLKTGTLSRLDVAFSRDQPEKVYVQHRMLKHSREIYAWLEQGAVFYVCGDATRMANDVHHALISIVTRESGRSGEEAEAYIEALKKAKRYQRDVY